MKITRAQLKQIIQEEIEGLDLDEKKKKKKKRKDIMARPGSYSKKGIKKGDPRPELAPSVMDQFRAIGAANPQGPLGMDEYDRIRREEGAAALPVNASEGSTWKYYEYLAWYKKNVLGEEPEEFRGRQKGGWAMSSSDVESATSGGPTGASGAVQWEGLDRIAQKVEERMVRRLRKNK